MKEALIIFVRHPQLGKVKTRLAATIGNEAALSIYIKLLEHTKEISRKINAAKYIFYSDEMPEKDIWSDALYNKHQQQGTDLGSRMHNAFQRVLTMGYHKVCIAGSDCFELTPGIVTNAFSLLDNNDVVIGPASDGGYYLLGMKHLYPSIFWNKNWSTPDVLQQTKDTIEKAGLRYALLPTLTDVDEEKDVPPHMLPL